MNNFAKNPHKMHNIALKQSTLEAEPPRKKLVTDADVFIKKLAENQTNTKVNLQQELLRKQQFTSGTQFASLAHYKSGSNTLKEFLDSTNQSEQFERLKSLGLTDQDIDLLHSFNADNIKHEHPNLNESALANHLEYLQAKIKAKSVTKVPQKKRELVPTEQPESTASKLWTFAKNNEGPSDVNLAHPLDDIKIIETKLNQTLSQTSCNVNKIRKKARRLGSQVEKASEISVPEPKVPKNRSLASNSQWDIKEASNSKNQQKVYECKPQNYYTIKDGVIVNLNASPVATKLSLEEIRRIPKFENYEPGIATKILFVKNLPNKTSTEELRLLFKEFANDFVINGKMRGRAFLEFKDPNTAEQVLHSYNGIVFKNKPVIIQFSTMGT